MSDYKYDYLNNSYFNVYEDVGLPKVLKYPLGDITVPSDFDVDEYGGLVAHDTTTTQDTGPRIINDNTEEVHVTPPTEDIEYNIKPGTGKRMKLTVNLKANILSSLIDEVAKEPGYEDLSNQNIKKLIMMLADRESKFDYKIPSKSSSAVGYFLFVDGTRKLFSNASKSEFINNPKELIRAAYKYFKYIHSLPDADKLRKAGFNDALITVLGWWYPRSMRMVLDGKRNFSLGGYSIKQAFEDYG